LAPDELHAEVSGSSTREAESVRDGSPAFFRDPSTAATPFTHPATGAWYHEPARGIQTVLRQGIFAGLEPSAIISTVIVTAWPAAVHALRENLPQGELAPKGKNKGKKITTR